MPDPAKAEYQKSVDQILDSGTTSYTELLYAIRTRAYASDVLSTACAILGWWGNKRATPTLLAVLNDTSQPPFVLVEAAKALEQLESKSAIQPLIVLLLHSPSTYARRMAAYALGWLGLRLENRQAVPSLIAVVGDTRADPAVRGEAAEALANMGNLGLAKDHPNPAVEPLTAALSDPSAEVRFWAAFALGQIGDPRPLPVLRWLAATDHRIVPGWWSVSREAADAIAHIEGWQVP